MDAITTVCHASAAQRTILDDDVDVAEKMLQQ
jgi:hypothetical protein